MSSIRVRFAPSPTGELHIGGARTALFNWLFARKYNGTFILRIDDTDTERSHEYYWKGILDAMRWLGLDWDEGPEKGGNFGPYFQSQRFELYIDEVNRLLKEGKAYRCYCTVEELAREREKYRQKGQPFIYPGTCRGKTEENDFISPGEDMENTVIRFLSPDEGETVVDDLIRGEVSFDNKHLDDFIILKSNGSPTYNFATVVDDWHMQISHIIRAEEHLSNTPRQQLITEALNYSIPSYAHVPMILAPDKSKLSKRHGATSVQEFKEKGYLPEAVVNYLALLGWSPPGEEEILPLEEIKNYFSLDRVVKTAAIYDIKKITWINSHYFKEGDADRLTEISLPFLQEQGFVSEDITTEQKQKVKAVLEAMRDRVKTFEEFVEAVDYFFCDEFYYEEAAVNKIFGKDEVYSILETLLNNLKALNNFNRENLEKTFQDTLTELEVKAGQLNKPVRLAVTGKTMGPDLIETIVILGKEKTLKRLEQALEKIQSIPSST